jgi:hypothetical protein
VRREKRWLQSEQLQYIVHTFQPKWGIPGLSYPSLGEDNLMNGTSPLIQGFMIPVDQLDFATILLSGGSRNICSSSSEATLGAPWWACENIKLTGTVSEVTARVGDNVTIQVGIQALPTLEAFKQLILSVQAWVCYPNTVAGGADASLVVPSMQGNQFASFNWGGPLSGAPAITNNMNYQQKGGFLWISLSPWIPQQQDFMDESSHEGHCCIIANCSGLFDYVTSGIPVGFQITLNSQLNANINVCTDLYQGQRNIVIVPASGHMRRALPRFAFLSGAPGQRTSSKTAVAVTAIQQGSQVDPLLLPVLSSGPYAGLPLKPASAPPRSLRLARHDCSWNGWLSKLIHEAEEIVEELLGLDLHPFGGGHRLHLSLPPQGLQPLHLEVELDPAEPPGTVHSIQITQTDANGARGGIRAGIVVT